MISFNLDVNFSSASTLYARALDARHTPSDTSLACEYTFYTTCARSRPHTMRESVQTLTHIHTHNHTHFTFRLHTITHLYLPWDRRRRRCTRRCTVVAADESLPSVQAASSGRARPQSNGPKSQRTRGCLCASVELSALRWHWLSLGLGRAVGVDNDILIILAVLLRENCLSAVTARRRRCVACWRRRQHHYHRPLNAHSRCVYACVFCLYEQRGWCN